MYKFIFYRLLICFNIVLKLLARENPQFGGKFTSVTAIKILLMEKFSEQVPDTIDYGVVYFEAGKQAKKRWLCCTEDIEVMYNCHNKGDEITLWCESRSKQKWEDDTSTSTSKRQTEIDAIFKTLKEKHIDKYENPKLRLWPRMIVGGLHEDTDEPPKKKRSTMDMLSGAVEAFAKVVERTIPCSRASLPETSISDTTLHPKLPI